MLWCQIRGRRAGQEDVEGGAPIVRPGVPRSTRPARAPDAPQNTVHARPGGRLSRAVRGL